MYFVFVQVSPIRNLSSNKCTLHASLIITVDMKYGGGIMKVKGGAIFFFSFAKLIKLLEEFLEFFYRVGNRNVYGI